MLAFLYELFQLIRVCFGKINDFSYSLGAGGVMTGSINVITLNMNRFVQNILFDEEYDEDKHLSLITSELRKQIRDIHKYQVAVKALFEDFENKSRKLSILY